MTMSDMEKCKIYKEIQSSVKSLLEKGTNVDRNVYESQLISLKTDLAAKNENVRKAALEFLDFLLTLYVGDIQSHILKVLLDSSVNRLVQNCVLKSIKKNVIDAILEDKFDFTEMLLPWKNQNVNKLTNIIEEVCLNDLSREKCKEFFIGKVITAMMDLSTDNDIRNILTDMAFMLSTIVPISDLSPVELEMFLKDVNTKYVKNIGDLRDQNYSNWHNLWIFLVRFCDKNIHHSMELTNKLLRVVEYAFRNSSIQQRLKGYDCWKELIDNASLDMEHMCSPKQIKLLVTPLKAKFSKQEVVISKRFDVFAYLLEKLQHKAVLCLTEFLEFCFGPVGDSKDISKVGQGKTVPQIWTKSTKVLVDIIGHSHGNAVSCLTTEDVIKLEKPIINHTNILNFHKVTINSVAECCSLLKEVDIESKRETVINCMWKSVFNLIIPTTDAERSKYFQVVSDVLENYIKQSRENPYFEDLLILIFTVLMSYDKDFVYEVIQYILKQLLTVIFTTDNFPTDVADSFKSTLTHTFSKILTVENKLRVIKELVMCFAKLAPNDENMRHINKVWLCVANELISDFTAQRIEEFTEFNNFLMWPAFYLHHLDDSAKKQTVLYWMKLYRKISMDSEKRKQSVMNELEKIFRNNPLLSSNIVSLLNVMSQFETKFTKEFVVKLMSVASLILVLPNLKTGDEQKITALVMQYFEPSLECYKNEQNEEVIKNICICIKHILCFHKGYKLLDTLAQFVKNSPDNLRTKFSHHLSNLLLDLYTKEADPNNYGSKELQKVISVFNEENRNQQVNAATFIVPGGRSARIANLAKNSPRSPQKKSKKIDPSPTALRLFGKDIDTMSPLRVKGSQLSNASPKSKRGLNSPKSKPKKTPSINDEKSSDFVPIDTEVKFQPEKLSKHQREVLRRRREDIPALYQDLSQSTSQDMFASSSSARSSDTADEAAADSKKVIVEMIGHHFKENDFQKDEVKEEEQPFVVPPEHVAEVIVSDKDVNTAGDLFATEKEQVVDPEETVCEEPEKNEEKHLEESKPKLENFGKDEETSNPENLPEKTNTKSDERTEDHKGKKRRKIEAELLKLKMDIVGADEFFAASRRTRTRERPKRLEEVATPRPPSKEDQHLRMSVGEGKIEIKADKNRRKTIGTLKDVKSLTAVTVEHPKLKENTQPDLQRTPKTSRRKQSKSRGGAKEEEKMMIEKVSDATVSHITSKTELKQIDSKEEPEQREAKAGSEKKGHKRKQISCDEDSEDIIESSQESHADVTPIFNTSKKRSFFGTSVEERLDKSEEKTLVQQKTVTTNEFVPVKQNTVEEVEMKVETIANTAIRTNNEEDMGNNTLGTNEKKVDTVVEDIDVSQNKGKDTIAETEVVEESEEVPAHIEEVGHEVEIANVEEIVDINMEEQKLNDIVEPQFGVNTTQDTTITQDSTQEISQSEDGSQNQSQYAETQSIITQTTQTQDTQSQSECGTLSDTNQLPVLYFDLPKKPELTDSERIMCRMDTMSICSDPNNLNLRSEIGDSLGLEEIEIKANVQMEEPKVDLMQMEDVLASATPRQISNLPSSPVTVETPNRTTELLNSTMDISPINSKSSSDTDSPEEISVSVTRNLRAEMEELERVEKEDTTESIISSKKSDEKTEDQSKIVEGSNPDENLPSTIEDIINILEGTTPKNNDNVSDDEKKEADEVSLEFQVFPKLEETSSQIEEIPQDVPLESDTSPQKEDVLRQVEVPHQLEDIQTQIEEIQSENQTKDLLEQTGDVHNQVEVIKPLKENNGMQERTSKLLNMVSVSSPMSNKVFIKKRVGGLTMSPSSGRIKRLMLGMNQKPSVDDLLGDVKEEDILTFKREVPSPLAVPRGSILKRKLSDTSDSDGISPCPKRKRVNFSDPCLTSKKLFIKDDYRDHVSLEAKCLFPTSPEPKTIETPSSEISDPLDATSSSDKMTETENLETEPSLEVVNPLILRKDKPIYPKLVDCKEDVMPIIKRVTSPMFVSTLMNRLKNKDIQTIGDLARQSEAEVNRFPFKVPVVANVYKALDNYYKKNVEKSSSVGRESEVRLNGGEEEGQKTSFWRVDNSRVNSQVPPGKYIRSEFKGMIERSKKEGVFEDLTKILLSSLEKEHLITLVKSSYKIEPFDFLEEKDFKCVIKHIIETIGLPSVFELLTESVESSENESIYFDCMIRHSIGKRPLIDLLENRSLNEIRTSLEDGISKNMFAKIDILETCFIPLIESPNDILSYLNRISVVELGNVIVQRLEFTDLQQFFNQIIQKHGTKNVSNTLSNELIKHLDSTSEIVDLFRNCVDLQSSERQKEVMIEMFRFISGRLDLKTLLDLHVGFLQRIPNSIADKGEDC